MEAPMTEWLTVAIQAGGAAGVCAMFLWFLSNMQKTASEKEARFFEQLDKQTAYLRERDKQSKEIAFSGHAALREISHELSELRDELKTRRLQRGA